MRGSRGTRVVMMTLVAAALIAGGCGGSRGADPHLLSTVASPGDDPINGVTTFMSHVRPGEHFQLRVDAYVFTAAAMTFDKMEVVNAKGVTVHDYWTRDARLTIEPVWGSDRAGWKHDIGARSVGGTVIQPGRPHATVYLNVDVTIAGKPGDDVSRAPFVRADALRVWWHSAGRNGVTLLPLGFPGCSATTFIRHYARHRSQKTSLPNYNASDGDGNPRKACPSVRGSAGPSADAPRTEGTS